MAETRKDQCPKCGGTMVEQADDRPGPRGITLSVPNGKYKCYHCEKEANRAR